MDTRKISMAVLALIIIVVLFKCLDRYIVTPVGFGATSTHQPIAYKMDRWTGKMWLIRGLDAYEVKNSPLASPADGEHAW